MLLLSRALLLRGLAAHLLCAVTERCAANQRRVSPRRVVCLVVSASDARCAACVAFARLTLRC